MQADTMIWTHSSYDVTLVLAPEVAPSPGHSDKQPLECVILPSPYVYVLNRAKSSKQVLEIKKINK